MLQTQKQLTELEADLKAHFDKLPKDVQKAILSVDYEKTLKEITQRYHLHIDQGAKLETETTIVMLGLAPPKDFSKNLIFEARIDPKAAEFIAGEINEKIFRPIISSLHTALMEKLGGEEIKQGKVEDHAHDLSPVEIGVSTVTLPTTQKQDDVTAQAKFDAASQIRRTADGAHNSTSIFEQKLEGITGLKSSETVVSENTDNTSESEGRKGKGEGEGQAPEEEHPSLYKGKSDPYHEPIE